MNKIVILDGYTCNPGDLSWDALEALGSLTVYDRTAPEEIISRIGDAQCVFTNKTILSRQVIEACPHLRFIGVLATGYNVVDLEACTEKGIVVCNIPSYSTDAVAQMTFALLLEICHHVADHSKAVFDGAWTSSPDFCFWNHPLIALSGKTLGIIGYGSIGQAVAGIAQAFGIKVLYHRRNHKLSMDTETCRYASLDELLTKSDIISLHCPLTEETKHIICPETIARMKDGVILLNTSRGPLIDEDALVDALETGKIYAAGVDVVSAEPIRAENPLLRAKNLFITPHIAWAPKETRERLISIAVENLRAYLAGTPVNQVNR